MSEPLHLGLPELASIALAVRIILSVAWLRYGERPERDADDPPAGPPNPASER